MPAPTHCFLSYAHRDSLAFDRFRVHVNSVMALFGVTVWDDGGLKGGVAWDAMIRRKIKESQVFILLTTNDLLGSHYVLNTEIPEMIREHKNNNALILPVILRDCGWKAFFGNYIQALPRHPGSKGVRPIQDWHPPESGFSQAAHGISEGMQDWFGISPRSPFDALRPSAP